MKVLDKKHIIYDCIGRIVLLLYFGAMTLGFAFYLFDGSEPFTLDIVSGSLLPVLIILCIVSAICILLSTKKYWFGGFIIICSTFLNIMWVINSSQDLRILGILSVIFNLIILVSMYKNLFSKNI